MATATKNRVPVSLRLPRDLVDTIETYILEKDLKKTDAYIHFLQRGIALEQQDVSADKIDKLDRKIDGIIKALAIDLTTDDSAELESIKRIIADVAKQFPAIDKAYIFGSFARGSQTENSDIDIKLDLDEEASFRLNDLSHFMKLIEQKTDRECDVVTAKNLKNENLAANITRERVLVYERKTQ